MAKRLSEHLADLSVHAKNAEDAADAAQKEAPDKIVARKEQARAAATRRSKRSIRKSSPLVIPPAETGVRYAQKSRPT